MRGRDIEQEWSIGTAIRNGLKAHPAFSVSPLGDWAELVGVQVACHSQPRSLKNGVLKIIAEDSVWKHHLDLNREYLIHKINLKRPEPIVTRIDIKVGPISPTASPLNPNRQKAEGLEAKRYRSRKKKKAPVRPLTSEEKALLKSLPDAELREIGARLLRRIPLDEDREPADPS